MRVASSRRDRHCVAPGSHQHRASAAAAVIACAKLPASWPQAHLHTRAPPPPGPRATAPPTCADRKQEQLREAPRCVARGQQVQPQVAAEAAEAAKPHDDAAAAAARGAGRRRGLCGGWWRYWRMNRSLPAANTCHLGTPRNPECAKSCACMVTHARARMQARARAFTHSVHTHSVHTHTHTHKHTHTPPTAAP